MIAGIKSGCGKTTITCGILQLLLRKNLKVSCLKCGPDYIDPMFHEKMLQVRSGNIDGFFMNATMQNSLLAKQSEGKDITVLEGVMGYYDGIGMTCEGGSYAVSMATKTPVILIVDCKGMGASIGAVLHGFLSYRKHQIKGVIFNQLPARLYEDLARFVSSYQIKPLGYVPYQKEFQLESRHLGLVTANEISDIRERMTAIADVLEETLDVDGMIALANQAEQLVLEDEIQGKYETNQHTAPIIEQNKKSMRIGLASDEAFCFIYQDNLVRLHEYGCELIPFSPCKDRSLPSNLDGLLLYGGYPELHAKELSDNTMMKEQIKHAIEGGMPTIAECGGFLYLHEQLVGEDNVSYPMVGLIKGQSKKTSGLKRFGYVTLQAKKDNILCKKGELIKAHEFHYFDSTNNGNDYVAMKAGRNVTWDCIHATKTLYAGFPHLHFYQETNICENFVAACRTYHKAHEC